VQSVAKKTVKSVVNYYLTISVNLRKSASKKTLSILSKKISAFSLAEKSAFLVIFLLTFFGNILKYPHVCQQANVNRQ